MKIVITEIINNSPVSIETKPVKKIKAQLNGKEIAAMIREKALSLSAKNN